MGKSDSEVAKDATHRSVNGWSMFHDEAPISVRRKMMPVVALSVTEAKLFAAVLSAQDMIFILNHIRLNVLLPTIKKEPQDNWLIRGQTHHIEFKQNFYRELKKQVLLFVDGVNS